MQPPAQQSRLIAARIKQIIQREIIAISDETLRHGPPRRFGADLTNSEANLKSMVKCWAAARDPMDRFGLVRKVEEAYRRAVLTFALRGPCSAHRQQFLTLTHVYDTRSGRHSVDVNVYQSLKQIGMGFNWMFDWLEDQIPPLVLLAECADEVPQNPLR